jgi:basic membrane protein A
MLCFPALLVSACAPRPQDCARTDVFCAGLVTDFGPIKDGINQEAWQGLLEAKAGGLVDRIDAIETIDTRDRAKNISALADDGYDVIITGGASISAETMEAALKYPNILFIGVEQPQDLKLPNLSGLVFREDRSGFLSGALAAITTQTRRIAAVCEAKFIDEMRRYCDGFQAGAKYINPGVYVTVSYREGAQEKLFNDPDWGRTAALRAIDDGADVLFAAGGGTADAALEAAAQQGATVMSSETDAYLRMSDIRPMLETSAISDIRTGVKELAQLARDGHFPSGNYFGQTLLAPFHEWERQIPQSTKDRLELIAKGLSEGSILTGIPWSENEPISP